MSRTEIIEKLKEILRAADNSAADECNEQSNLALDLGLNSVNILYLVIAVEEMFGIEFDDVVGINAFATIGDVADYIERKLP